MLYTYFHYCNYLPIFTLVATYVLTLYWFQIWLLFCHCVLPKLYIINFLVLQAFFRFFSPHIFPAVTVNCDKKEKTQINEFERHSLSLPFNTKAFGKLFLATTMTVLTPVSCVVFVLLFLSFLFVWCLFLLQGNTSVFLGMKDM